MEDLISRARAGDRDAFAQIVKARHRLVYNLAAGYLGWRDAEDAAQIIWTAVWRKLWQVEEPVRFDAWLRTLVLHQCLNLRKARARNREREVQLSPEAWLSLTECVAADGCPVQEVLEHREMRCLISRMLDELPGEYGMLLRLYYLRDMSYNEISALTGLPLSTLKWRLHQGRKLFRTSLNRHLAKLDIRRFSQ